MVAESVKTSRLEKDTVFVLIFTKMPVGFVMALIGFAGFGYIVNFDAALNLTAKDLFDVFGSYNLTVIPCSSSWGRSPFIPASAAGSFKVAYKFIGHWPGGMAIATIGACTGFSAICGSTNATAATMAAVTLPEMRKYHYKDTSGRRCGGGRRQPGHSGAAQRGFHHLRHHDRAVHRQAVHGRHRTGPSAGRPLHPGHRDLGHLLQPEVAPRGPRADFRKSMASLSGLVETLLLFAAGHGRVFFWDSSPRPRPAPWGPWARS
jgi:C4-dicarboxylate transporter DctM subunit